MASTAHIFFVLASTAMAVDGCSDGDAAPSRASSPRPATTSQADVSPGQAQYDALTDSYRDAPTNMDWRGQMMSNQMHHVGSMHGAGRGASMNQWHADMARWHEEMAQRGGPDAQWHRGMMQRHGAMAMSWSPQPVDDGNATGAQLYERTCAGCHGADGRGVAGAFPPLANDPAVKGDAVVLARIALHGVQGDLSVAGQRFTGVMPGAAAQLDDAALAKLLTYVRSSFGNNAPAVTPQEVAAARAAAGDRAGPLSPSELGLDAHE